MSEAVVDGATVVLTTDGTWLWASGTPPTVTTSPTLSVTLSVVDPTAPPRVQGHAVARESDVAALTHRPASHNSPGRHRACSAFLPSAGPAPGPQSGRASWVSHAFQTPSNSETFSDCSAARSRVSPRSRARL